ncbi:helix-turn-helix domain-containing protein [Rubrivivax sp. RP6-9]|uniref:helix-turn-helix domain-containing protein n=1 Tax=Rubrivivax sp. RP6-9 TaxID=3415750 RepID=UPI003CC53E4B
MTESADADSGVTAGGLLRAAREKQGLHIAALAASIKVAPRKLDALENNRFDELPDATFTRALAQTVCRSLKIDPLPVLALLPPADASALDHVGGSLSEPFRERPGRADPATMAVAAIRPMVWAGLLLLVAAVAVYFVPADVFAPAPGGASAPGVASAASAGASAPGMSTTVIETVPVLPGAEPAEPVASAASGAVAAAVAGAASAPVVETVFSAPPLQAAASAASDAAAALRTLVQLRADEASWVEVRDGRGQLLLSRTVQAGESVGFDGPLPIRMTIGNAPATRVSFRGKPVDLAASTRDSVARLELQ